MTPAHIVTHSWLRLRMFICMLCGIAIGFTGAIGAMAYAGQTFDSAMDKLMATACKFPSMDGQATTWARTEGKIYCWELR